MAGALHWAFYTHQCFTAFLCCRSYSQSPPSMSVCLLSVSVWIQLEPLLPFRDLCPKVSLSFKLSSKCIQAHSHKTRSQMPSPKAPRKGTVVVVVVGVILLHITTVEAHLWHCFVQNLEKPAVWGLLTERNSLTIWEITLLAFLPRVRWEYWYNSHICLLNINLKPGNGWHSLA